MRDFKDRIDKLLTEAGDCELIGGLAADPTKRASFRRLAEKLRSVAAELKAEMDTAGLEPLRLTDREFLLRHAGEFRDMAADTHEEQIRSALIKMAEEFEGLADKEQC